jgi:O-antigen ligase
MHESARAQPAAEPRKSGHGFRLPPAHMVLLLLAGLVPVVFVPGGGDAFEPHKAHLLATGAALIVAAGIAHTLARIETAGWVAWSVSAPSRVLTGLRADPLGAAVLLFVLSSALSTALSPRPMLSLFGNSARPAGLVTACATAAVFFGARGLAARPGWFERLLSVASLAGLVAAGYAVLQLSGHDPVGWEWTALAGSVRRVPGTLGHPNHLGSYLAMTLPAMLHLARRARRPLARAGWIGGALAAALVLALTLSRGAWLALAAAALTWGALEFGVTPRAGADAALARRRARRNALIASGAVIAVFLLPLLTPLGASFVTRLREVVDARAPTTRTRVLMARAAAGMVAERPLTGIGTDAFGIAYPRHRVPEHWMLEWNPSPAKAHSEPVQITATQGLIGLAAALLVMAFAFVALLRLARSPEPEARQGAGVAGAALAAFAVSGLASFTVAATGTLAAALAGWVAGRARLPVGTAPARPRAEQAALGAAAALLLWVPLVLTPWRAVVAASPGIELPAGDPRRAESLARAVAITPWDTRYRTELGRTQLVRAMAATDSRRSWRLLADAREQFERARSEGAPTGEESALLAHVLSRQAAMAPDRASLDRARHALDRALASDSTSASVLELVAEGYQAIGLAAEARGPLLRCARLYPDFALPLAELGFMALDDGRAGDAADTLEIALRRNWHDVPHVAAMARTALEVARARRAASASAGHP